MASSAYKIVSKSKIVLMEAAGNTGRKTWKTGRPGEIYQKWNMSSGNKRIDVPALCKDKFIKK